MFILTGCGIVRPGQKTEESMLLFYLRSGASLVLMFARLFYRKFQLRLLGREADKRIADVDALSLVVGRAFRRRTALVSGAQYCTLDDMGYDCDQDGNRVSGICWNAPIGITIYLSDKAHIGLGVELRGRVLSIRQMQGVYGQPIHKIVPDWPEVFVQACIQYALQTNLREVRIYKADQDFGYRYPVFEMPEGTNYTEVIAAHRNRLRRRYDRTAQKLKFTKKKKYYVWVPPPQAQVS
jgi:hypothetical protein